MIIECVNCNKKFNVDSELIPSHGRKIQCGSCNHIWHYTIKDASSERLILDNIEIPIEFKEFDNQEIIESESLIDNKKSTAIKQKTEIKYKKIENRSVGNFFSYLLVLIISFVALLILVDTLKSPLIDIFPQLEIILFNLFETFKDVKLFINDLT
jgi:predicted Zn finger-like uncharacterized protein